MARKLHVAASKPQAAASKPAQFRADATLISILVDDALDLAKSGKHLSAPS